MKQKKIFILAAAALAFAACSSDESPTAPEEQETGAAYTQGEVPVAFGAYVNRGTTRAITGADLTLDGASSTISLQTEGFGVFGYYTDNKPYSETSTPNFMYNQKVSYDSGDPAGWKYTPVKYWPNEFGANAISDGVDMLTFFAYAPYVAVTPKTGRVDGATTGIVSMTSNTATGDPIVKYCVAFDPKDRVDLCWGVAGTALTASVDAADGNNVTVKSPFIDVVKPKAAEKLDFQFYHALAALNVQIDADVDDERGEGTDDHTVTVDGRTRIWVRSVTFEGFTDKGALNLYSTDATPKPNWLEYSNTNTAIGGGSVILYDGRRDGKEGVGIASNEKICINEALTQGDVYNTPSTSLACKTAKYVGVTNTPANLFGISTTAFDAPIYVIPTDETVSVTIVYDVETWDDNVAGYLSDGKVKGSTIENKITKTDVFNTAKLEAGKKYTLKLHLGMTSVKFDADVEDWGSGSSAEADLPYNKES